MKNIFLHTAESDARSQRALGMAAVPPEPCCRLRGLIHWKLKTPTTDSLIYLKCAWYANRHEGTPAFQYSCSLKSHIQKTNGNRKLCFVSNTPALPEDQYHVRTFWNHSILQRFPRCQWYQWFTQSCASLAPPLPSFTYVVSVHAEVRRQR